MATAAERDARWRARNPERAKRLDVERQKRYLQRHPERRAAYEATDHYKRLAAASSARYRARHADKVAAYKASEASRRSEAAYRERNREKIRLAISAWQKRNAAKVLARVRLYQASKIKATPAWANKFFMEEAYHLAELRTQKTGFKWNVDHIVPLRSKLVCGLHVEHNLQVIPAVQNIKKGNRVWPDMPSGSR